MAKILHFKPPVSKESRVCVEGEVINIDSPQNLTEVKRCLMALAKNDVLYACQQCNKGLEKYFENKSFTHERFWLDLLDKIYGATGNDDLLYAITAKRLIYNNDDYLFNLWAVLKAGKKDTQAKKLEDLCVNNHLVPYAQFHNPALTFIDFDKKYNINMLKRKIIRLLNKQLYNQAFKNIHIAYELDKTDPFLSYLYFNADEAFDSKIDARLPDTYIMSKLNAIKKALQNDEEFSNLWKSDDAPSLVRFLVNYGDVSLNEQFFMKFMTNMDKKKIFYCNLALATSGQDKLKAQLLLYMIMFLFVDKAVIVYRGLPRMVEIKDMDRIKEVHLNFLLAIMEALPVLLELTQEYKIDLTYEINQIIKGADKSNAQIFENVGMLRDAIVYYYLTRRDSSLVKKIFKDKEIFKWIFEKFNINVSTKHLEKYDNVKVFKAKK